MKETNKLTKDRKYIIPLKEYRLLPFLFISHKYSLWYKNLHIHFKSRNKTYPLKAKISYSVEELRKDYKSKWGIPTNEDWVFTKDGKKILFKDIV